MTCVHLQQLYKLCREYDLKLAGADLIRVVCPQCGAQEVCPSNLMDQCDNGPSTADDDADTDSQQPTAQASQQK